MTTTNTNLFQSGDFTLNSGAQSKWKIECDALTPADWLTLAHMVREVVGPFGSVEGVPKGGWPLAAALEHMADPASAVHLIVDDVLTTGGSMEKARVRHTSVSPGDELWLKGLIKGAVVFARGKCPSWIVPLFQLPPQLWVVKAEVEYQAGKLEPPGR